MKNHTKEQTQSLRAAFARDRQLTQAPVSARERDALIATRSKPILETHLSIGGHVEQIVRQDIETDRELRIGFINKRLNRQNGKAREHFRQSR
jgi:hypothetical protein